MSRVHLGMKRPIRQFEKSYEELKNAINYLENIKFETQEEKEYAIKRFKTIFNDCVIKLNNIKIIQLNNIKNTQIEYLEK